MDIKEKFLKKKRSLKWFQERIGNWYWNTFRQSSGTVLNDEHAKELHFSQKVSPNRFSDYRP